ncbi:hypothetical protein [Pseudomonas sp. UMAB-40]|uniref:hypothetical protein n=1 Tax=Pseudomonas sp. UMAB-40 TaxID=1365407 RepID=UPI001C5601C3|nr:hypothetical protein [Pseudomonas sp. UMAB-40]
MSKVKATLRGKTGKHYEPWDGRVLKLHLFRKVAVTNRTDTFLLESLFSKRESKEPVGPLAGKARA